MQDVGAANVMSQEAAIDVIKCLGVGVTGNVPKDGWDLEEGSKYRKCLEL